MSKKSSRQKINHDSGKILKFGWEVVDTEQKHNEEGKDTFIKKLK